MRPGDFEDHGTGEPVTRVSAAGDKTRIRTTSSRDAAPERLRSPSPRQQTRRAHVFSSTLSDFLENDDDSAPQLQFDTSLLPRTTGQDGSGDLSSPKPNVSDSIASQRPQDQQRSGPTANKQILISRWLGSTFEDSEIGAEVAVDASPPVKGAHPLIRWQHLERSLMSFDEFISAASSVTTLDEDENRHLKEVLRKVRKEHEKQRQHGRDMEPFCIADVDSSERTSQSEQSVSICLLSMPFFSLSRHHNKLTSLASGSIEHASRPLLQAHTRITNDRRELMQAVSFMPKTPKGHTLHVGNVWCLIVNESTIITCSTPGIAEVGRDIESKTGLVADDAVIVKAGNSRGWRIPKSTVRDWVSLTSLFAVRISDTTGPEASAAFTLQDRRLVPAIWEDLLKSSDGCSHEISLVKAEDLKDNTHSYKGQVFRSIQVYYAPLQRSRASQGGSSDEDKPNSEAMQTLHLFERSAPAGSLTAVADALHKQLSDDKKSLTGRQYAAGREGYVADVRDWLETHNGSEEAKEPGMQSDNSHVIAYCKGWIAVFAQHIVHFFWPADFDHVMVGKFFGAVNVLLDGESFHGHGGSDPSRDVEAAQIFTRTIAEKLVILMSSLGTALHDHAEKLQPLPTPFYSAWLSIIGSFIVAAHAKMDHDKDWKTPVSMIRYAADQLKEGERLLTSQLRKADIEDFEVCSSRGLIALILRRLCQDIISNDGPDVAQIYDDYTHQLEARMISNPLTRAHQESLRYLQQEFEAVHSTLTSQLDVLKTYACGIRTLSEQGPRPPLLPSLSPSRLHTVLAQTTSHLNSRISQFEALQQRAQDLSDWHLSMIETHKDRQEAAIMVFTIVTIIFLPLSFVSGVFGMNTADMRDMSHGQWAYWAAALPLTIIVVIGSLWWAGVFDDFRPWVAKVSHRSSGAMWHGVEARKFERRGGDTEKGREDEIGGAAHGGQRSRRKRTYPVKRAMRGPMKRGKDGRS